MRQTCGIGTCGAYLTIGAAARGLRLCPNCRKLLAGQLIELPRLYRACEQILEVRRQHPVGVPRGRRLTGVCLDELTVTVRGDTVRLLASFCKLIIDERDMAGPASLDVPVLSSFLLTQLDWLAAHAVAVDFAEEIAAVTAALAHVLNPVQTRTIELGPCTAQGCGRMVRASVLVASARSAPQVRCDAGHTWQPRQWLDLRHKLSLPGQAPARGLTA